VPPQADALRVDEAQRLQALEGGDGVNRVGRREVRPGRFAFRIAVPAQVDLEDDETAAGQGVHVGDITPGRDVGRRGDEAVIEDDGLEAAVGCDAEGHGQQAVDPVALREVAGDVLVVVGAIGQRLLDRDLAACDLPLQQGGDGQLLANLKRRRPLRQQDAGRACAGDSQDKRQRHNSGKRCQG